MYFTASRKHWPMHVYEVSNRRRQQWNQITNAAYVHIGRENIAIKESPPKKGHITFEKHYTYLFMY